MKYVVLMEQLESIEEEMISRHEKLRARAVREAINKLTVKELPLPNDEQKFHIPPEMRDQ